MRRREDLGGAPAEWVLWLHLVCAALAGAIWYLAPQAGPWPLALVLVPWAGQCLLTKRLPGRSGFELPLLLFLASAAAGVWAAFDRSEAWPKLWRIVGGMALFYALQAAAPLGRKRVWLLSGFGAIVAAYFLATHDWEAYPAKIAVLTQLGQTLQAPLPSTSLHRLHPNVAGGILAMLAPFSGLTAYWSWQRLRERAPGATGHAKRGPAWISAYLASCILLLVLFGLVMSTSRGAWIALGCALLLVALWSSSRRAARAVPTFGRWLFPALVSLLLVGGLSVVAAWPGGVLAALSALPGPETGVSRVELLRNSMSLVRDYPFTGAGLGGFQMLYSTYALFLHVGYAVHSHNLLVNVAVEQGLPGVAALCWMGAILCTRLFRGVSGAAAQGAQADRTAAKRIETLAAAGLCLVVVAVHGLVDDVLYGSRAVLLLFLPLSLSYWDPLPQAGGRGLMGWLSRRELVLPLSLIVALAMALAWRKPLLSLAYSDLGAVHQSRAELGAYSWPKWPLQDEVRRTVDLSRSIGEFERALTLDPHNAVALRRLAMIDLATGRYERALERLQVAYAVEPGSDVTRSLLAEAYVANGRVAEGRDLFAAVGTSGGRLAARVFWYGYLGDEERQGWMKRAVEGR